MFSRLRWRPTELFGLVRTGLFVLGLSARTVQRWRGSGSEAVDGRALHYDAVLKLLTDERAELLAVANSVEFAQLPPSQIVPRLAEQGRYIASESTFYGVLRKEKQLAHHRSERPTRARSKPRAVCPGKHNQLFSRDITYTLQTQPTTGAKSRLSLIVETTSSFRLTGVGLCGTNFL